jgi:polysaccharide deacetylase 2 family uncharacterized protein YibQ
MDDDLRQPLKRRSFLSRLFAARPTALRAATVSCIAALAGVGVWAVASHEPYGGQPVVHMQIDTSDPIVTSSLNKPEPQEQDPAETGNQTGGDTAGNGQLDSDGGTEVIDLTHLASRQARRDGETDFERLQRQLAQKNRVRDEAEVESPADAISIDQLPTSRDQAVAPPRSAISLVPAPVSRITGKGPHGALPVVAKDGSKAAKLYARPVPAEQLLSDMPKVALLIGGMGLNAELTRATVEALPPEISLAFAPYGENLQQQANAARARGHEVFLQLPMEPFGYPSIDPGPRTLLTTASAQQNVDSLHWHLSRFSGYAGVTNYLGAQFAANEKAFGPVLHELGKRGLVYVDDGSKGLSRATGLAGKFGLPARSATITLDGDTPEAVAAALQRLEAAARQNGFAIGTGAGLPATIKVIEQWHRSLGGKQLQLVPVTAAFASRRS